MLVFAGMVLSAGCTGSENPAPDRAGAVPLVDNQSAATVMTIEETQTGTGEEYEYSGSGYAETPRFTLPAGPATFTLSMSGKHYNGAILYDGQYRYISGLVDQPGPAEVHRVVEIVTPGEYFLGMNAPEGSWNVSITR